MVDQRRTIVGAANSETCRSARQRQDLLRVEAARLGDDMARADQHVREVVHAGAVRHRRGVEDAVRRRRLVDVGK
jgi:hypothetical protein